jgi:hypothetical protein
MSVIDGLLGTGELLAITPGTAGADTTLCWYLIEHRLGHPLWHHYVLCVVTLDDRPGVAPAKIMVPGATHELIVVALDPTGEPYLAAELAEQGLGDRFLAPVNVVQQFTATDAEAADLAELCVVAVCDGRLWPETADAPGKVRESWRLAIIDTLDHGKGH